MNKVEYQNLKMILHDKIIMFKIEHELDDEASNKLMCDVLKLDQ